jgi:hypothetical protein
MASDCLKTTLFGLMGKRDCRRYIMYDSISSCILSHQEKPRAETSSSAGLQRCSAAFLRRFRATSECVWRPISPPAASTPRRENLTGPLLHCTVRHTRELPRLCFDTSALDCPNTSPLLPTLPLEKNRRPTETSSRTRTAAERVCTTKH